MRDCLGSGEEERALVPAQRTTTNYKSSWMTIGLMIVIHGLFLATRTVTAHATQEKQAYDSWEIGRDASAEPSSSYCSPGFFDFSQALFSLLPVVLAVAIAVRESRNRDNDPRFAFGCSGFAFGVFSTVLAMFDIGMTLFIGTVANSGQRECGIYEGWLARNTSSNAHNPFTFIGNWYPSSSIESMAIQGILTAGDYVAGIITGFFILAADQVLCRPRAPSPD